MRKFLRFLMMVFIMFVVSNVHVSATHMMGADLSYTWVSGNIYKVTLTFYRDCAGNNAPQNVDIVVESSSCNYYDSYSVSRTGGTNVSAVCPAQLNNTACNGGSLPGVQKYTYITNVTLPYNCNDWKISWRSCCRNNAISTTTPGNPGDSIYLETRLNNIVATVNNSPTFSSLPVPYFCQGQLATYNHGAFDADGDSLAYELIAPLETPTSTVTYINPYNGNYPIATTPANSFNFSTQTGQMTFTPSTVQQGVLAIRVKEYRNGQLIGSVMRDIQLVILNCGNNQPVSVSSANNVNGATSVGANTFKTCVGNTMSFSITASDPNANTTISMSSTSGTNCPGSTFTVQGTNPRTGTFTWAPTVNDVGYKAFTITISDGACPIPSTQVIGFAINVVKVDLSAPDFTVCPGVTTTLQLGVTVGGNPNCLNGTCLTWTPSTGLSATNIANPIATVNQPITYNINFNDGLCNVNEQLNILPAGSITINPQVDTICPGTSIQLVTTNSFPAATNTNCNLNNALCSGGLNTFQVGSATTSTNNTTNLGIGSPYQGAFTDGKMQFLYRASELQAAGLVAGLIRSLAFNVTDQLSTIPYANMTIRIGCYSSSVLSATTGYATTNLYQVYSGNVIPTLGWNTYNFTTPFQWGGTTNLLVEVCFDNTVATDYDHVQYTQTTFNSVLYKTANAGSGCTFTGPLVTNLRPNIQFSNCTQALPPSFSWTTIAGCGTSSLTSVTSSAPFASPTLSPTVYVITATNGACTVKDTATIYVRPQPTINNTPNVSTCPLDTSILVAGGTHINSYSWSTGATTQSIAVAPLNTTTYTVHALTSCGTLSDTVKVTTVDVIPPTILGCPPNDTLYVTATTCSVPYSWTPPTVTDNCPFPTIVQNLGPPNGSSFPVGNTLIRYKATDNKNNATNCLFTITVLDTIRPVISNCPANITVNATAGLCGRNVTWTLPTRTDNCPGTSLVLTQGIANGGFFPVGTTFQMYVATDAVGNKDTCTFTVTVIDNQAPTIVLPPNIVQVTDSGVCGAVVTWPNPVTNDNCPGDTFSIVSGIANGGLFPLGTSQVVFVAIDTAGNVSAQDTLLVTIIDTRPPDFYGCLSDTTIENDTTLCGAVFQWIPPTAIDNCSGAVAVTSLSPLGPGDVFPLGSTLIQYTTQDASGNKDTCSFVITVIDTELPIISGCPANILVPKDTSACGATVSWIAPTATDNCSGMTFIQTSGLPSGSFLPLGPTNIVYTATDGSGNVATCTFEVFVSDVFFPVIQNCPGDTALNTDVNVCGALYNWPPITAFDNCPGTVITLVTGLPSGSIFPIGTTVVTFVATDAALNTDTCTFTVTVTDVQFPVIQNCPSNITLNNTSNLCGRTVNWTVPTVFDNCPNATLVGTHTPGTFFPVGTTTVTYIATDSDNHTDTCVFTITIVDAQAPTITGCPTNIIQSSTPTSCDAVVSWTPPTITDNCGLMSVVNSHNPGDIFTSGVTTVTYTATDSAGNVSVCTFTVTINDSTPPLIAGCPSNITLNTNANCVAVANWIAPTVTDNCPGVVMISNYNSGDTFAVGTTQVIYTATDGIGNTASCVFTVTVTDSVPPVISGCPANISFNLTSGCDTVVTWALPTAMDNCGIQSFGANHASGDVFGLGTTTVTYIALDTAGNADTCTFTITLTPPTSLNIVATVLSDVHCLNGNDGQAKVVVTGGSGNYIYSWTSTPPQANDTASGLTVGTYTVFVSDANAPTCVVPVQATVSIIQLPVVTVGVQGINPTCFGFTNGSVATNVTGGTTPYTYSWNTAAITPNIGSLPIGYYEIWVTDAKNCTDSAAITLTQPDSLSVLVSQTNVDCYSNATGAASVSVSGGTPNYNYVWSDNSGTPSITNVPAGNYSVIITDQKACTTTRNFTITEPELLTVTVDKTPIICHNSATGTATATVQGGTQPYDLIWSTNPAQSGLNATNIPPGSYTVVVTDNQNCIAKANFSLSNPPVLDLKRVQKTDTYCSFANGSIDVIANGGVPGYTYTWDTNPIQYGTSATQLYAGTYQAMVVDTRGCKDSLTITLNDTPPATTLFTSTPDNAEPILLSQANLVFQNQTVGGVTYSWHFGDKPDAVSVDKNPKYTFFETGSFIVTLTAWNGHIECPTSYSQEYEIIWDGSLYIPNAFSPNNDGNNDYFGAIGDGITSYSMEIYDRWGKVVFSTNSLNNQWDGMINGQAAPEGVYSYHLIYTMNNGFGKERAGTITLIR